MGNRENIRRNSPRANRIRCTERESAPASSTGFSKVTNTLATCGALAAAAILSFSFFPKRAATSSVPDSEGFSTKSKVTEINQKPIAKTYVATSGTSNLSVIANALSKPKLPIIGETQVKNLTRLRSISPIFALNKIANFQAKDPNGQPYYPRRDRSAVNIARHLIDLSKDSNSGITALKISKIEEAPAGAIICYPSNSGEYKIGSGKGIDKYGCIDICSKDGSTLTYICENPLGSPAQIKKARLAKKEEPEISKPDKFIAFACSSMVLPSEKQMNNLAKELGLCGKETLPGIVTHVLEVGDAGPEAVSRMKADPGGASYGQYQLSSRKGSLAEFVNFCIDSKEYHQLGEDLKKAGGLTHKKIPITFDKVWKDKAATMGASFQQAQEDFVNVRFIGPIVQRAEKYGFDTQNLGVRALLYSMVVQFGVPPPNDPTHKCEEILKTAHESLPASADCRSQISNLWYARSGVMLRMGEHQLTCGNINTGIMYLSIAEHRYLDELILCLHLDHIDKKMHNLATNGKLDPSTL